MPALSVVVPFYNVEAYLEECLESIRTQSFGDFEVVLVDDGSPDGSAEVARRFVAEDDRFRLVVRENGGLGAARNTGVREARGESLTFVDSDDALPPGAFAALVSAATRTGADVVAGSVEQFDGRRSWSPDWVPEVQAEERVLEWVEEFLPVLRNLYTWNKLFRRDFWDRCGLWFREGVAYEDQPIVTELFAAARGIVVLPEVVYRHRVRADRSSISQQVGSRSDLHDRISAWRDTRAALADRPEVYAGWLETLFSAHFHWYFGALDRVDDAYWEELRDAVVEFLADAPRRLWEQTVPTRRVPLELVRLGRRDDLVAFVAAGGRNPDLWPARLVAGGLSVELPFHDDPALAADLFLLRPEQVVLEHRVDALRWRDEDLEVTGWAYLRRLEAATPRTVSLRWHNMRTGAQVGAQAEVGVAMVLTAPYEDFAADYRGGGFRCRVPVAELVERSEPGDTWQAGLLLEAGGLALSARGLPQASAAVRGARGAVVTGDRYVVPVAGGDKTLRLRVEAASVVVDELEVHGRELRARLTGPGAGDVARVRLAKDPRDETDARRASDGGFAMTLPEPVVGSWWPVEIELADGTVGPARPAEALRRRLDTRPQDLRGVRVMPRDVLAVGDDVDRAVVDAIAVVDGRLRVTGRVLDAGTAAVTVTVAGQPGTTGATSYVDGVGHFAVDHDLREDRGPYGRLPLPSGDHVMVVRVHSSAEDEVGRDAVSHPSASLQSRLPMSLAAATHDMRAVLGPRGGLRLRMQRPLGAARGPRAQRLLRLQPSPTPAAPGVVLQGAVGGTVRADLVRVAAELLRQAPGLPVWWVVRDHSEPVPDGLRPVLLGSAEHSEVVGSVRHVVGDRPVVRRDRPSGQVLVHLLEAGADEPLLPDALSGGDVVVTPAPEVTAELLALGHDEDRLLELGSPRLDRWHDVGPADGARRDALRRWLGVTADQVVLLADLGAEAPLDVDELADAVGQLAGHDVLVVPRDASRWPDLGDLVLVAGLAVVTDRSASLADLVAAGRQVILVGPGTSVADVVGAIGAPGVPVPATGDRTALPHDDGAAAARVVSLIL